MKLKDAGFSSGDFYRWGPLIHSFHLPVCPFLPDRVYKTQNRPDKALGQCEKSLRLLRDCGQPEKMISVYRDMAAIEQDRGRSDRAVEHLSKASSPRVHNGISSMWPFC